MTHKKVVKGCTYKCCHWKGVNNPNYGTHKFPGIQKIPNWLGKNNPFYGRKRLSKSHRLKIKESCKNLHKGKDNPMWGRRGELAPRFRILPPHGKRHRYKKKCFRSGWELKYAKYLDKNNIKWQYEPKSFIIQLRNKKGTYTPDFYLPDTSEYIEIKGIWRDNAKSKYNAFLKQYPDIKLNILYGKDLKVLGVLW